MYKGKIIDCDVHHTWRTTGEVVERLPQQWRDLASGVLGGAMMIDGPDLSSGSVGGGHRLDSYPADGTPPGSSYEVMRDQLLDPCDIDRVVLGFSSGWNNALPNPYFAQAVVRAVNDWNLETWLSIPDDRLCSVVLIPGQVVEEAVAEIRRIAEHPRIVAGLFGWNSFGKPLGHPVYHPIYEALAEFNLPLTLHVGAGEYINKCGAHTTAGGLPASYYEWHVLFAQMMMHHLASMIVHGVFEKFPHFKLICVESGTAWLPWLMANLDANYRLLRRESPLLKKNPSQYLRDHVRLTTQPLETSRDPKQLVRVLETIDGVDSILCFSSDYPHWDSDNPRYIAGRLPDDWLPMIFHANAQASYRWPSRAPAMRAAS